MKTLVSMRGRFAETGSLTFTTNRGTRHDLLKRAERYFLEEDDIVIAVILQTKESKFGPSAAFRLIGKFLGWNGLSLCVVGDLYAVHGHDGVRPVESDIHCVPLRPGFARPRQRLRQRIERAGNVILVFALGDIVDLYFVA